MNYFTGIAIGSAFEFPYSGHQTHQIPSSDNSIDAILASIAPLSSIPVYNQTPLINLQCVPQINTSIPSNTLVYQVPENMPLDTILQQLGVNSNTLQPSNTMSNYYRTAAQPLELVLPPSSSSPRPRRLVCREVSDSEEDGFFRRPSSQHDRRRPSNSRAAPSQQSSVALHDILNRVWRAAERHSPNLPPSFSAPDLNSSMRNRSTPPPNTNVDRVWGALRNASPPILSDHQNAINNVWQRADYASRLGANRPPQPSPPISSDPQNAINNVWQRADYASRLGANRPPQPSPPPNREAMNNFFAARNIPLGANAGPPTSSAAVNNFFAALNAPFGANTGPPPPSPAVRNFFAARDAPFSANAGPLPPNAGANNLFAPRNAPFGVNTGPPSPSAAVNNFPGARNVAFGVNQPNPAVSNVWNRIHSTTPQGPPFSSNPPHPALPVGRLPRTPAPASFAALLSQAHRQHLPYAGAA